MSDRVNLFAPLVLLSVCFIYSMSGRYSPTGTGRVDPARKFKCTTAARDCFSFVPAYIFCHSCHSSGIYLLLQLPQFRHISSAIVAIVLAYIFCYSCHSSGIYLLLQFPQFRHISSAIVATVPAYIFCHSCHSSGIYLLLQLPQFRHISSPVVSKFTYLHKTKLIEHKL